MNDSPEKPRSHTIKRLLAAGMVMAGSLIGGVGLSALARSGVDLGVAFNEVQAADEAPAAEFGGPVAATSEPDIAPASAGMSPAPRARRATAGAAPTPIPVAVDPPAAPPSPPPPPVSTIRDELNLAAAPTYGAAQLNSGFSPDPYLMHLSAGGSVDAATIGGACRGFVARGPDMRISYVAGSLPLYISVQSDADTTLVVNAPDGAWYCDDDGAPSGLDPLLVFEHPQSGQYDIWVGALAAGATPPATLRISEVGPPP